MVELTVVPSPHSDRIIGTLHHAATTLLARFIHVPFSFLYVTKYTGKCDNCGGFWGAMLGSIGEDTWGGSAVCHKLWQKTWQLAELMVVPSPRSDRTSGTLCHQTMTTMLGHSYDLLMGRFQWLFTHPKQLKKLKIAYLRSSTIRKENIQELFEALNTCTIITGK